MGSVREHGKLIFQLRQPHTFQPIRNIGKLYSMTEDPDDEYLLGLRGMRATNNSLIIRRTGRYFGGLVDDVRFVVESNI